MLTEVQRWPKLLYSYFDQNFVQVVTFLGWRLGGWPGAIIATIMFLVPAFAIMVSMR